MLPKQPPQAAATPANGVLWLNQPQAQSHWLAQAGPVIALDTEFVRERTFWPRLALVQMSAGDTAVLVDPLQDGGTDALGQALADPDRTILMHSASEDLTALRPIQPAPMLGLYDTQLAAAFAGLGPGIGYQGLVSQLTGTHLEKQETRSDWLARPLSPQQIDYALDDVRYLAAIHAILDARLAERGYRDWHREDCRRLAEAGWHAEPDPQPQLAFRNAWRWPLPAQALLRRMLLWREQAARERDLPRRWVIDDDALATAAVDPDHAPARLAARLDAGPPGRRRALQPLLNLAAKPLAPAELEATAPIKDPRDPAVRAVSKRLRAEIQNQAGRLDLPPGLLCPRRAIDALAENGQWPAELAGWRRDVLEQALMAQL